MIKGKMFFEGRETRIIFDHSWPTYTMFEHKTASSFTCESHDPNEVVMEKNAHGVYERARSICPICDFELDQEMKRRAREILLREPSSYRRG